jgi:xylan 1,4-beta-xylosidase
MGECLPLKPQIRRTGAAKMDCMRIMGPGSLAAAALLSVFCFATAARAQKGSAPPRVGHTYSNPIDLDYRFSLDKPSRREAADPTMVVYRGEYWLFASKSGGYWESKDLHTWKHIFAEGYPVETYAPTVVEIGGKLYLSAFNDPYLYTTDDPAAGKWRKAASIPLFADPDLFLDKDRKLYAYAGCSNMAPLRVTELEASGDFHALSQPAPIYAGDPAKHGWEVPGDTNEMTKERPWIEGSWMTKHGGKYYLQYAGPGTQYKTYGDGVLVADSPTGPFAYADYNPVSFKPTGFIAGAGHSSTFQDLSGAYWHVSSMTISVRHMFERRLGLFPTWFTPDGQMVVDTYLGDYPHKLARNGADTFAGWFLLDLKKPVTASSSLPGHEPEKAVDEDIRTWWSAATGNAGEWLQVDMGAPKRINAIQINFADEGSDTLGASNDAYRYVIQQSLDGRRWTALVDRSDNQRDAPDEYIELEKPALARYVRITNVHTPGHAKFSISGLRLFGNGFQPAPARVGGIRVVRDPQDGRLAVVSWQPVHGADFYIVRFGVRPDRMFENYQVYDGTQLTVPSLNVGVGYSFTVDAVNDSGVTVSKEIVSIR